jgi:signal transduction histidine kinase
VSADEQALRRAVTNLVGNGIKYAGAGGLVRISVREGTGAEVQISVSDRGPGIDPEDLPHLFEPFYRSRHAMDRQIHGNGLGLALVKRVVEAYGGRVTVESTPGQGATFILHLATATPV